MIIVPRTACMMSPFWKQKSRQMVPTSLRFLKKLAGGSVPDQFGAPIRPTERALDERVLGDLPPRGQCRPCLVPGAAPVFLLQIVRVGARDCAGGRVPEYVAVGELAALLISMSATRSPDHHAAGMAGSRTTGLRDGHQVRADPVEPEPNQTSVCVAEPADHPRRPRAGCPCRSQRSAGCSGRRSRRMITPPAPGSARR